MGLYQYRTQKVTSLMMKPNKRSKVRWGILAVIFLSVLIIGIAGIILTMIQMVAVDQFVVAQGSGSMSPREAAAEISDKRQPQLILFYSLSAIGGVSTVISFIGFILARRKKVEQGATHDR